MIVQSFIDARLATTAARAASGTVKGHYATSGYQSMCAGAMIYLEKMGCPTVGTRVGRVLRTYARHDLARHLDTVIKSAN